MIKRINDYFFDEDFTTGDIAFYWGCLAVMLLFAGTALASVI